MIRPTRWALAAALLLALTTAGAETPEELFDRGNEAYSAGQFRDAAAAYRAAARYGIRDARLEYNLGNAEFKLGHLGQAILHYERARRLAPTDREIERNLEWARSFCVDQVEQQDPAAVVRWWRGVQDSLGPDRQALALLALFWVALGIVGWCASRPRGWTPAAGWVLSVVLVLFATGWISWRATHQRLEGAAAAVVLQPTVEVLAGPGLNNATLFTVHEGLTLEVRDERDEWLQVSLPSGLNGWLRRDAVARI